jgi:hypothetical protein
MKTKVPSWRDVLVFRRVKIEANSAAAASKEFYLTVPQVYQAVHEVTEYLLVSAPLKNATWADRERAVSQLIYLETLCHLQRLAMDAYRQSLQDQTAVHTTWVNGQEKTRRTVRRGKGSLSFLKLADQMAVKIASCKRELKAMGWNDARLPPSDAPLIESGVAEPDRPPLAWGLLRGH